MRKVIYIFIIFLSTGLNSFAQVDTNRTLFGRINDKFFDLPNYVNYYTLGFDYGFSTVTLPAEKFKGDLADAFSLGFKYGFTRFYDIEGEKDFIYFASETAAIANTSSHLWFKESGSGIGSDNWRFGIGYKNGYGYDLGDNKLFILYHGSNILWSVVDFESPGIDMSDQKILDVFDMKTKFGSSFQAGALYNLSDNFLLDAHIDRSAAYSSLHFAPWAVSSVLELLLQRSVDFIGDDMLRLNKNKWPVLNVLIKSGISFLFSELRRNEPFWLFESGSQMNNYHFKIGITYIFLD